MLGTGTLARFRIEGLRRDARVEWVGIGSARGRSAKEFAVQVGADAAGSVEEMLDAGPGAVVVASTSTSHAAQLWAALKLGVPILCEKPIATNLADSQAIVRASEDAGVQLQVGLQRRFDAELVRAREKVAQGALGELYSIRLVSHDRTPPAPRFAATNGGMFCDLHVHDFDLARWLSGREIQDVFAVAGVRTEYHYLGELRDVDTTAIVLRMDDGLPVSISGSRHDCGGYQMRAEILGSKGALVLGADRFVDYRQRFRQAFTDQLSAFLDVVAEKRGNPCPGREGLAAERAVAAAQRSHRERRVVSF
ncbi:Gfo/Idh/MocA family oxidoreductase [Amycolatopsis sp. K13G38]|uniref:Gfo/Idh/MocA family oxidoreductase n=1 Tax=Amycolatopsis acididurans TaxID=2724524 RepID=A0ABX1J5C5_9PSEU|nr:Gfo/Idh/MocA family oxidoreductase [Amycolatopsis acididurans]